MTRKVVQCCVRREKDALKKNWQGRWRKVIWKHKRTSKEMYRKEWLLYRGNSEVHKVRPSIICIKLPHGWCLPEHYLHWLVVFSQESTSKAENKPPCFSTSLSLYHSLCVSLLLLLSQGQRWALTSQGQLFAYKEPAFFLHVLPLPSAATNDTRAWHICQVKSHWS